MASSSTISNLPSACKSYFSALFLFLGRSINPTGLRPLSSYRRLVATTCGFGLSSVIFGSSNMALLCGAGIGYLLGYSADAAAESTALAISHSFNYIGPKNRELLVKGTLTIVNIIGAVAALRTELNGFASLGDH